MMSVPIERKILESYAIGQGLNIGCGKIRLGGSTGVDINPNAPAIDVLADGTELPWETGSQDYVLSLHNLEHYKVSTLVVLREWYRVLRPGGICAVIVPDGDRKMDAFYAGSGEHYHVFTVAILALYFRAAKLSVIEARKVDRNPERPEQTILCVGRK